MKREHVILSGMLIAASAGCASSGRPQPKPADNTTMTAEEVARHAHEPIEVMLQRKFPGVQVFRNSDGDITLNIRGATSTSGRPTEPLYIINDMEVDPGGRPLSALVNPYDIESIKVLKGPEAGIYGIRGADGVIIIKTKSPQPRK
ncbi:MAG TPA: TonB-dependent receptor plug domain-containing protein [Longimicrobiales bacterium]